jgi:hypothetical protein
MMLKLLSFRTSSLPSYDYNSSSVIKRSGSKFLYSDPIKTPYPIERDSDGKLKG